MDEILRALYLGAGTVMIVIGGALMNDGNHTGLLWISGAVGVYYVRELLKGRG